MSQKVPPKRDVMLALLQQAESVYVNFDPRKEGVVVPPQLKKTARVVLQYGMNMAIPIPDLDVGEDGIGATLSFDHRPCWTFVPWSAVFAIVSRDQRGMLWENDVPPEVELDQKRAPEKEKEKDKRPPAKKQPQKRPALRAVDGGRDREPTPAEVAASEAPTETLPKPVIEPARAETASEESPAATEDVVDPPRRDPKKKRELPPYLRVVK